MSHLHTPSNTAAREQLLEAGVHGVHGETVDFSPNLSVSLVTPSELEALVRCIPGLPAV